MAKGQPATEPAPEDLAAADPAAVEAVAPAADVVELESLPAASGEHAEAMPSLLADGSRQYPDAVVLVEPEGGDPRAASFEG